MMQSPAPIGQPPGPILLQTNDLIRAIVANELDLIRKRLEDIAVTLCGDATIMVEYMEMLQGVDELAQRNENLANLLRSDEMEPAIDAITLESLRNRMLDSVTDILARAAEQGVDRVDGETDWNKF